MEGCLATSMAGLTPLPGWSCTRPHSFVGCIPLSWSPDCVPATSPRPGQGRGGEGRGGEGRGGEGEVAMNEML